MVRGWHWYSFVAMMVPVRVMPVSVSVAVVAVAIVGLLPALRYQLVLLAFTHHRQLEPIPISRDGVLTSYYRNISDENSSATLNNLSSYIDSEIYHTDHFHWLEPLPHICRVKNRAVVYQATPAY